MQKHSLFTNSNKPTHQEKFQFFERDYSYQSNIDFSIELLRVSFYTIFTQSILTKWSIIIFVVNLKDTKKFGKYTKGEAYHKHCMGLFGNFDQAYPSPISTKYTY